MSREVYVQHTTYIRKKIHLGRLIILFIVEHHDHSKTCRIDSLTHVCSKLNFDENYVKRPELTK